MNSDYRCVVHVSTECYIRGDTTIYGKSLRVMRKHSYGFNPLEEYFQDDLEIEMNRIINLQEVVNGLYTLQIVNESCDWETGRVDDWDYMLHKFDPDG